MTPARSIHPFLTSDAATGTRIAARGEPVRITVAETESTAVQTAVSNLAEDLRRSCGAMAEIVTRTAGARIVVGTLGTSPAVDDLVAAGRLDLDVLRDENGNLHWEGYLSTVVDDILYLVGADRRGTIYAAYDFTEAIGVSPWRWWADVPVRERDQVTLARDAIAADWPAVRYRGIFINDEEELDAWARLHTGDDTIGPETYARICELILRLRGNYLWPAMHVGAFNHDPTNGRLADELGIVVGTSHCDMLLRSNEHEFGPWEEAQGEPVQYDYSLPGRNRELLRSYWRGSVIQNRDHEVTWTVGMRGIHDYGFQTTAIDEDDSLSPEVKFSARVDLLGEVIADQRRLLSETLDVDAATVPQLFIPYKEVLPLYDAGLDVPDDVTIVWANDNFGHIRRFPDEAELGRSGGHGLYYHCSYWSDLTTSYLATSSTPLALMKSELSRAWDAGIRRLWVSNVGGIKPLEHEMTFFLRSAWEAGRETSTAEVDSFTAAWFDAQFSGNHGEQLARIHGEYSQLNQQRKVEHLTSDVFPQAGDGDEAGRRLERLRLLYEETNEVLASLPPKEHAAFLQLLAVKVHLTYLTNAQFVHADRSSLTHSQGKLRAADRHLEISRAFDANKRALIHFYNHVMSSGRWEGIFTPEHFPPPVMPLHPAGTPALRIADAGLGVLAWGEETPVPSPTLHFHPHGTPDRWIEVFNTGSGGIDVELETEGWLELSRTSGTVTDEIRIGVRLTDPLASAERTGRIRVTSRTTGEVADVTVMVAAAPEPPPGFAGALEADGHISIDPSRPEVSVPGSDNRWEVVPRLGRYGNAALQARRHRETTEHGSTSAGIAGYGFHLETPGEHLLEIHRLPTLDSTGRIRVGIRVDDHPLTIAESPTTDEHRGAWEQSIQDNIEKLRLRLPALAAGPHKLRLQVIDAGITVSKLIIHTVEPSASNLGPEFSTHTRRPRMVLPDPNPTNVDLEALAADARRLYSTDPADVPPHGQVYAGEGFWEGATTFRHNVILPQAPGIRRFDVTADGKKDVIAEIGSGVVLEEGGSISFEAENVLAEDVTAWTTPGSAGEVWSHTQAETNGRTGLAMHVLPRGLHWQDPTTAPGLHQQIRVTTPGRYRAWLLVKYDDRSDDACVVGIDGRVQPPSDQFCGGELATYGTRQVWVWALLSELDISAGDHTFSVFAGKSGLKVDRIHLTLDGSLPPTDDHWVSSARR